MTSSETSFLLGTGAAAESQPPSIHSKVAQIPWYRRGKWKCGIISIIICGAVTLFALFIIIPATSNVRYKWCVCVCVSVCLYMIFDHHPQPLYLQCYYWVAQYGLCCTCRCNAKQQISLFISFFSSLPFFFFLFFIVQASAGACQRSNTWRDHVAKVV